MNLLPAAHREAAATIPRWRNRALAATASALLVAVVALPLLQKSEIVSRLEEQVAAARGEALQADQVRKELQQLIDEESAIVERRKQRPSGIQVLEDLTRLLPDSAWLNRLEMNDARVTIRGEAANASDLVKLIESSGKFRSAAFEGAMTRDARTERERFTISATAVPMVETMIERPLLQGRVAAVAATIFLAVLVYLALIRPVVESYRHYDERIAELTDRLQRYQRAARDRETSARLLEQRKRSDPAKRLYLGGQNASLAASELQGVIKRVVEESKGELLSMQVIGPTKAERASEVTVKVRVKGDIQTCRSACMHWKPGVQSCSSASYRSMRYPATSRAAVPGKADVIRSDGVDLSISIDVTGYLRKQPA